MAIPPGTMAEPAIRPQIRLSFADDGEVFVDAAKGDRFLLTVQQAIIACGAFSQMADFQAQMRLLLDRLGKWVAEHRERVRDAYLTVRGSGLFYLVVTKELRFDDELEEALTQLDLDIANDDDFNLLKVEVLAIPNSPGECVEAFLRPTAVRNAHA